VVEGGHVHLGAFRVAGAGHLAEGSAATAFVRPHDVRVRPNGSSGHGTDEPTAIGRVERISSLGWLARLTIRLDGEGNHTLVAHVPQSDLAGAREGDLVSVDLRNPKAFDRAQAEAVVQASEDPSAE
jgi:ABC-type sulfate/molybdate transport systems ATPase subunit